MFTHLCRTLILSMIAMVPTTVGQVCSALSVEHQGSVAAGGSIAIEVSGAPADAIVVLVVSRDVGSSCVSLGQTQICLDVDLAQAGVFPIGETDAAGDLHLMIKLPPDPSGLLDGETLHFQAVAVVLDTSSVIPSIEACVSDAVAVPFD
jgi:hypothetical protein